MKKEVSFLRLTEIPVEILLHHMNDPRVSRHLPLYQGPWGQDDVARFIAAKEWGWQRDGLGHLAVRVNGEYAGWGGFEKLVDAGPDTWDFGLVLSPAFFGQGARIMDRFMADAQADARIVTVTFLLPVSRRNTAIVRRSGAAYMGEVLAGDTRFRKYELAVGA